MNDMKIIVGLTVLAAFPALAQTGDVQSAIDRALKQAQSAMQQIETPEIRGQLDRLAQGIDLGELERDLDQLQLNIPDLDFAIDRMFAFDPQSAADEARQAQQQAREQARAMAQQARELARENRDRSLEIYQSGTNLIDSRRYEQAIKRFDEVIANKWARADGAYYWKAYALDKLEKRDEALAALAEIPQQFPQSRWINDASALQVEIQQESGHPVSPDSQSDQDLKLLAINALMNSEPDRTVPLLQKVLNDPKNDVGVKSRALFVLAQNPSDKARDIVLQYAKNGSNPDLQIRAVTYLGTFRSKDTQDALAQVYAANTDVDVRRAVLHSMMISRDKAHLLNAAKSEPNADLRREAIRSLGMMQAAGELAQLYASEKNNDLKQTILESLMMSRATDQLLQIAKTESNPDLRTGAIRYLATMHADNTANDLSSLYTAQAEKNVKSEIIRALGRQNAGKQLVAILRSEKDPELKKEGIEWLGRMRGSKEATDYLMEIINK